VPSLAKSAIAPIYLFLCLILGGSAQGVWLNMLLQLLGVGIIAWSAAVSDGEPLPKSARALSFVFVAVIVVVVIQLVPLPAALWGNDLRARISEGYRLLGITGQWVPIALSPYAALDTLLAVIPPVALFCAILSLGAFRASWLAGALLAATGAGIVLGVLQVAAPGPASPWYFYPATNRGLAVGFFANANHMADLLVVALPFVAALAAAGRSRNVQRYSALLAILLGTSLVLVIGIILNGSLAGFSLSLPAIIGSVLIVAPPQRRLRVPAAMVAILAVVVAIAAMGSTSIGSSKIGHDARTSVQSREEILKTTAKAIGDAMPWGTGLGSFRRVYALYESPDQVTPEYVVHAHNDYAELILELGIAGALAILLFLAWWARMAKGAWRIGGGGPYARAASVASAVILVHSLVDFPLRTGAISAVFAMCLALLIDRRPAQQQDPNDLRPTRHVTVK
jgi:O-antigen ligase